MTIHYHKKRPTTAWLFLSYLLLASLTAYSQVAEKKDTTATQKLAQNLFRPLVVGYERYGGSNFTTRTQEDDLAKGRLVSTDVVLANLSLPLLVKKKLFVIGNVGYQLQNHRLENIQVTNPPLGALEAPETITNQAFSIGVNVIKRLAIKEQKFLILANASVLTKDFTGRYQVTGFLGAGYVFKPTPRFRATAGLMYLLNQGSSIPVIPVATVYYQINDRWDLDSNFPLYVYLRRTINQRTWIGPGVEIRGFNFISPAVSASLLSNEELQLRNMEIRYGLRYEQRVSKLFLIGAKAGLKTNFNNRIGEVGQPSKDYYLDSTIKGAMYFNVNISFSPQLNTVKK